MKKKRISPQRVTDNEIRNFASNNGCNIVSIERKRDANETIRIYIKYNCKCNADIINSSKWERFHSNPQCKICNKNVKINAKKDDMNLISDANDCKIIRFEEFSGHLYVNYICNCDNQKICRKRIDKFKSFPMCKNCIYKNNPRVTDDDVRNFVQSRGLTYVKHWRVYGKNAKIIVEFICNCGNRNPCIREKNSLGYGCNVCKLERTKSTNFKKYGTEHYMQNSTARLQWEKRSYKYKKYIFPSGRSVICQGYENWALDLLILYEFDENDILTDHEICTNESIPQFWYEYEGKIRRYYPDIYIKSERKFIEVKSTFTANYKPHIINLKRESVLKLGFEFELWVFDIDGCPTIM